MGNDQKDGGEYSSMWQSLGLHVSDGNSQPKQSDAVKIVERRKGNPIEGIDA